jgi:hypothetical protein
LAKNRLSANVGGVKQFLSTQQLPLIRFSQPRPGNLNHDGRREGQQKAGHLSMSGPDDLALGRTPMTPTQP